MNIVRESKLIVKYGNNKHSSDTLEGGWAYFV